LTSGLAAGAIVFDWRDSVLVHSRVQHERGCLGEVDRTPRDGCRDGCLHATLLDLAYKQAKREGRLRNLADLQQAILEGAVKRLRPKFMTVATTFLGLVPIMWAVGTGSDVMKRIAAPLIGGILTSFVLELVVYPPVYQIWRWNFEVKRRLFDV
jgi:hypothetical protein